MLRSSAYAIAASFLLLSLSGAADAAGSPGPLKNWPCKVPFVDRLTPEATWPATLPAALPEGEAWRLDPQARAIVEFIASPENSPRAGAQYIETFARENGKLRPELAMLALAGMVEQINKIRDILLEGIRTHVVRSHILAEAVAENDQHLAEAQQKTPTALAEQPEAIRKARLANLRALGDAGDGADMLCHRYAYDEAKAKSLAAAIQQQTQFP